MSGQTNNCNDIPAILRGYKYWCLWKREQREGKATKIPYNPKTGGRAQSNNPETFTNFNTALKTFILGGYSGLGIGVFDNIAAIDLDRCVVDGKPNAQASDIISTMNSYAEFSPSGTGVRIIFKASGFQYDKARYYINNQAAGIEIYIAGCTQKFVTVTGNAINSAPISERAAEVTAVLERYMQRKQSQAPAQASPAPPSDVLEKAFNAKNGAAFKALWQGDITGYTSQSEADMALCNHLAFWCSGDIDEMDALFRQSGLMREKWNRTQSGSTYGRITLENAAKSCKEYAKESAARDFGSIAKKKTPKKLTTITALELQTKVIPPITFYVLDLLPQGLSLLASPPKFGKSWFALDLCLSVSAGLPFLNRRTKRSGCLYLALEDSERRLKTRMNRLLGDDTAPDNFFYATASSDLANGLIEELENHVSENKTGLIVIDTLQKVRPPSSGKESAYSTDYREAAQLKAFADKYNICVLLVHHLRKAADDDPFNRISGTNGLFGAADTAFVLTKEKRGDNQTRMSIAGRDVEPDEIIIKFDKESCCWKELGKADWLEQERARLEYQNNPTVVIIKKLIEANGGSWQGTCKELIKNGRWMNQSYLAQTPEKLSGIIRKLHNLLFDYDGIMHEEIKNGSGGKVHRFFSTVDEIPPTVDGLAGWIGEEV